MLGHGALMGPTKVLGTGKASKNDSLFKGMSSMREQERKAAVTAAPPKLNTAMNDYLKKYAGDAAATATGSAEYVQRKRKKKTVQEAQHAIRIVDQDVSGFSAARKPPTSFSDEEEDDDCESTCMQGSLLHVSSPHTDACRFASKKTRMLCSMSLPLDLPVALQFSPWWLTPRRPKPLSSK